MLEKLAELVWGEIAALEGEFSSMCEQVREIAAWLGIPPRDAGLGVATLSGVLAYLF